MTKDLFLFVLLQTVLARYDSFNSYTAFNTCLWFLCVTFKQERWWPLVFCNTISLTGTFYASGWIIDRTFFVRMREAHQMSMIKFVIGDVAVHLLPSLWLLWSLDGYKRTWKDILVRAPEMRYCGLYSLLLNLLWAGGYGFELGSIYVPNSIAVWYMKWAVCAMLHLGCGALLVGVGI